MFCSLRSVRAAGASLIQGYSSAGRAAVSKTVGRGFDPFCPCHNAQFNPNSTRNGRFREISPVFSLFSGNSDYFAFFLPTEWVRIRRGNPCRVLREISERGFEYYSKDRRLGFEVARRYRSMKRLPAKRSAGRLTFWMVSLH